MSSLAHWIDRLTQTSFACVVLIFVVTFLVFSSNVDGDWILDDHYQVHQNPYIQSIQHIPRLLTTRVWQSTSVETDGSDIYRPVFMLSYMLDYHLFGMRSWGFHLMNNILHALNAVLVFLLCSLWIGRRHALAAASLFGLHPIVTEAVTWIGGRMDLLVTLFTLLYLLTLYYALLAWRRRYLLYLPLLMTLGFYSKEVFIMVPVVALVVYAFSGHRNLSWRPYLALSLSSFLWLALLYYGRSLIVTRDVTQLFALSNLQNLSVLITRLTELLFKLSDQDFFNYYAVSDFYWWPDIIPPVVVVLAAIFIARILKDGLLFVLGCGLALLPLVPVSLVLDILLLISERYFYLPMAGVAIMAGSLSHNVAPLLARHHLSRTVYIGFLVYLSLCTSFTVLRNRTWSTEQSLYTDSLVRNSNNWLPYYYLAHRFQREGRRPQSMAYYQKLLQLNPNHIFSLNNLAVFYIEQGRFAQARKLLLHAWRQDPTRPKTYYNIGFLFESEGQPERAKKYYAEAMQRDHDYQLARDAWHRVSLLIGQ